MLSMDISSLTSLRMEGDVLCVTFNGCLSPEVFIVFGLDCAHKAWEMGAKAILQDLTNCVIAVDDDDFERLEFYGLTMSSPLPIAAMLRDEHMDLARRYVSAVAHAGKRRRCFSEGEREVAMRWLEMQARSMALQAASESAPSSARPLSEPREPRFEDSSRGEILS